MLQIRRLLGGESANESSSSSSSDPSQSHQPLQNNPSNPSSPGHGAVKSSNPAMLVQVLRRLARLTRLLDPQASAQYTQEARRLASHSPGDDSSAQARSLLKGHKRGGSDKGAHNPTQAWLELLSPLINPCYTDPTMIPLSLPTSPKQNQHLKQLLPLLLKTRGVVRAAAGHAKKGLTKQHEACDVRAALNHLITLLNHVSSISILSSAPEPESKLDLGSAGELSNAVDSDQLKQRQEIITLIQTVTKAARLFLTQVTLVGSESTPSDEPTEDDSRLQEVPLPLSLPDLEEDNGKAREKYWKRLFTSCDQLRSSLQKVGLKFTDQAL